MHLKFILHATAIAAITLAASNAIAADFSVSAPSAGAFVINGAVNPSLTLTRGSTYTFDVNTPDHPFFIKTAQITGSGSTFDVGVTNNGTEAGIVSFTVPSSAPATLYYQCGVHSSMTGPLVIVNGTPSVPAVGPKVRTLMIVALGMLGIAALGGARSRTRSPERVLR